MVVCVSDISVCRCGSGLSGQALTEAGHQWVGIDISKSMLGIVCNSSIYLYGLHKLAVQ